MRIVKYTGTEEKVIGRFGFVKPGDKIEMWEHEYFTSLDSMQFEDHDSIECPVILRASEHYDLRKIPWNEHPPYLHARLKKLGRQEQQAIYDAMIDIGVVDPTEFPNVELRDRGDHIHTLAVLSGWCQMSFEEIKSSPGWEGRVVEPEVVAEVPQEVQAVPEPAQPFYAYADEVKEEIPVQEPVVEKVKRKVK